MKYQTGDQVRFLGLKGNPELEYRGSGGDPIVAGEVGIVEFCYADDIPYPVSVTFPNRRNNYPVDLHEIEPV
ncbi:MAG: hypothetical protein WCY93_10680 [Anaerolineaceae bacterium]